MPRWVLILGGALEDDRPPLVSCIGGHHADIDIRPLGFHLFKLPEKVSTHDIQEYFSKYGTVEVEWMDDTTANVVVQSGQWTWFDRRRIERCADFQRVCLPALQL